MSSISDNSTISRLSLANVADYKDANLPRADSGFKTIIGLALSNLQSGITKGSLSYFLSKGFHIVPELITSNRRNSELQFKLVRNDREHRFMAISAKDIVKLRKPLASDAELESLIAKIVYHEANRILAEYLASPEKIAFVSQRNIVPSSTLEPGSRYLAPVVGWGSIATLISLSLMNFAPKVTSTKDDLIKIVESDADRQEYAEHLSRSAYRFDNARN